MNWHRVDPYERLAAAIVLRAVKDYRKSENRMEIESIERFFRSKWFHVLSKVDPEMLIERLRAEKGEAFFFEDADVAAETET